MIVALVAALLLLTTQAAAVHMEHGNLNPMTKTCWTDGEWGIYETVFTPSWFPTYFTVVGTLHYEGNEAPLDGSGKVAPNATIAYRIKFFAWGLSFESLINGYHNRTGGTIHHYINDGAGYQPASIWAVQCP